MYTMYHVNDRLKTIDPLTKANFDTLEEALSQASKELNLMYFDDVEVKSEIELWDPITHRNSTLIHDVVLIPEHENHGIYICRDHSKYH